jgi:hypothetical protein
MEQINFVREGGQIRGAAQLYALLLRAGSSVTVLPTLSLKPDGHYMYHQFNIQQIYILPTQCIYVFCMDLRTNSDYFPIQH